MDTLSCVTISPGDFPGECFLLHPKIKQRRYRGAMNGRSADFMSERGEDGHYIRTLTVIDQFYVGVLQMGMPPIMSGEAVAESLERVAELRDYPKAITDDNGSESCLRTIDGWVYRNHVTLDFIRPGRSVDNGLIESFNGRLRETCLNLHLFRLIRGYTR